MAKANQKKQMFDITSKVTVISTVKVEAENFTQALEKASGLKRTDFVSVEGDDYFDDNMQIVSITKEGGFDIE